MLRTPIASRHADHRRNGTRRFKFTRLRVSGRYKDWAHVDERCPSSRGSSVAEIAVAMVLLLVQMLSVGLTFIVAMACAVSDPVAAVPVTGDVSEALTKISNAIEH